MCGIVAVVERHRAIGPGPWQRCRRPCNRCRTAVRTGKADGWNRASHWGTGAEYIDLSEAGAQPFHDETLGLHITFNGEIYNYL